MAKARSTRNVLIAKYQKCVGKTLRYQSAIANIRVARVDYNT